MKKLIAILIVLMFSVVSCNQICAVAKAKAKEVGSKLEQRWDCKADGISGKLEGYLEASFCKEKGIEALVCPILGKFVVDLGSAYIAREFECDVEKVKADASNITELCSFVGL